MRIAHVLACALALMAASHLAAAQESRPDALPMPKIGEVLRVERDSAPPHLKAALRPDCGLEPGLQVDSAIQIFVPHERARVMAIAHCGWIVAYSRVFVFERGLAREPTTMRFPVIAMPQGVTTSEHIGFVSWNPDNKTITAAQQTDVCNGRVARHTYRHQGAGGLNGFALVRVEHAPACETNWATLWEARPWDLPR